MNMKYFKGLGGNWKPGKTKDSIVTDITDGCDPDLLEYYGGAVVCESIPDEYTRSLLIASKYLLKACMDALELVEYLDSTVFSQKKLDALNQQLTHAITKALTI